MSTTDRIRRDISRGASRSAKSMHERTVFVTAWEVEALCDVADAARRLLDAEMDPDLRTAEFDVEMALNRLDGEEET